MTGEYPRLHVQGGFLLTSVQNGSSRPQNGVASRRRVRYTKTNGRLRLGAKYGVAVVLALRDIATAVSFGSPGYEKGAHGVVRKTHEPGRRFVDVSGSP